MIFIQEYGSSDWYEFDISTKHLIGFFGAYHEIDESSDSWLKAKRIEADSWHDLYVKTGYCCLDIGLSENMWLSPEGIAYPCIAHTLTATALVAILYNEPDVEYPDDYLIQMGWVKVTNGALLEYYASERHYKNLTQAQKDTLLEWCLLFNLDINIFQ